jgi:hypothetical protein
LQDKPTSFLILPLSTLWREADGMIDEPLYMKEMQACLHYENFCGNYGRG